MTKKNNTRNEKRYFKNYRYLALYSNNKIINLTIRSKIFNILMPCIDDLGLKNIYNNMFPSYTKTDLIPSLYLTVIYVLYYHNEYYNDNNKESTFHEFMNELKKSYYYDARSIEIYRCLINKIYSMNELMYGDNFNDIHVNDVMLTFENYNDLEKIIIKEVNK